MGAKCEPELTNQRPGIHRPDIDRGWRSGSGWSQQWAPGMAAFPISPSGVIIFTLKFIIWKHYIYVELTKGQKLKIHFILFSHVYLTPKKTLFINLSSYPTFPKTVIVGTPGSPRLVMVSFKAPVSVQGVIKIFEFNRNRFQNKLNEKLNVVVRS